MQDRIFENIENSLGLFMENPKFSQTSKHLDFFLKLWWRGKFKCIHQVEALALLASFHEHPNVASTTVEMIENSTTAH